MQKYIDTVVENIHSFVHPFSALLAIIMHCHRRHEWP